MTTRVIDDKGRYVRTIKPWSLENFDNGYIDATGRFRVYLPRHHRAASDGKVFRSIVAYEAYTGDIVTSDYVIHHKNGNKLDDSKENLVKLQFGEHTRLHNEGYRTGQIKMCGVCGNYFFLPQHRIDAGRKGLYCSSECHRKRGKDAESVRLKKADRLEKIRKERFG